MELKCKPNFRNIVESNLGRVSVPDDPNHMNEDNFNENQFDEDLPFITYRDVAIQTCSPNMVDKAVQVGSTRSRRKPSITRRSPNYIEGNTPKTLVSVINNNSHGLMPNILYNSSAINYFESPSFRSSPGGLNLLGDSTSEDPSIYRIHNEIIRELNVTKRKSKTPVDQRVNSKKSKRQLEESYQDNDSTDLRLGLISENDDDPDIDLDPPLVINGGPDMVPGRPSDVVNDIGLEIDDNFIFTHHPTGLCYQIFNDNRSINKEMMEKVFSSVIGREDKFYLCLYPPHAGTCHSSAGKSTKIRTVKNHLTSHLFLYRCRLCGRTYKYYNNLFNHFNRHP